MWCENLRTGKYGTNVVKTGIPDTDQVFLHHSKGGGSYKKTFLGREPLDFRQA